MYVLFDSIILLGTHCNITTFIIPERATVTIPPYNGSPESGVLEIVAEVKIFMLKWMNPSAVLFEIL